MCNHVASVLAKPGHRSQKVGPRGKNLPKIVVLCTFPSDFIPQKSASLALLIHHGLRACLFRYSRIFFRDISTLTGTIFLSVSRISHTQNNTLSERISNEVARLSPSNSAIYTLKQNQIDIRATTCVLNTTHTHQSHVSENANFFFVFSCPSHCKLNAKTVMYCKLRDNLN